MIEENNSDGWSFDSTLFDIDASVSSDVFKSTLISLTKSILLETFPHNYTKQQIKVHTDRINFSCPICGDSLIKDSKRRGNIILEGKYKNYYKCFNCASFLRLDNFFKDFKKEISLDMINYIVANAEDISSDVADYNISYLLDEDQLDSFAIEREYLKKSFGLIEVKGSTIEQYLRDRLQFNYSKFLYSPSENILIILNLTKNGKILGIQNRMFSGDNRFLTYKLSAIYKLMNENIEIPEEIEVLSMLFNICLVNHAKPITLIEGPMDAFVFTPKNCVANTGANKTFPLPIPIRYCYDSDATGIKRSIQQIEQGQEVFLWKKLQNDINLPNRDKWDINDLIIWAKETNTKLPNLNNYFSNDSLDIIDI